MTGFLERRKWGWRENPLGLDPNLLRRVGASSPQMKQLRLFPEHMSPVLTGMIYDAASHWSPQREAYLEWEDGSLWRVSLQDAQRVVNAVEEGLRALQVERSRISL
jgi:hypothetical protein